MDLISASSKEQKFKNKISFIFNKVIKPIAHKDYLFMGNVRFVWRAIHESELNDVDTYGLSTHEMLIVSVLPLILPNKFTEIEQKYIELWAQGFSARVMAELYNIRREIMRKHLVNTIRKALIIWRDYKKCF